MASNGFVALYSEGHSDPGRLIEASLAVFPEPTIKGARRSLATNSQAADSDDDVNAAVAVDGPAVVQLFQPSFERLIGDAFTMPPWTMYIPGRCLTLRVGSPEQRELERSLRASIPEQIAGPSFCPYGIELNVGWHDLQGDAWNEEDKFIARVFYSLQLVGNGLPNDWKRYSELIGTVPAVQAIAKRLEAVVGPLKQCVFWI